MLGLPSSNTAACSAGIPQTTMAHLVNFQNKMPFCESQISCDGNSIKNVQIWGKGNTKTPVNDYFLQSVVMIAHQKPIWSSLSGGNCHAQVRHLNLSFLSSVMFVLNWGWITSLSRQIVVPNIKRKQFLHLDECTIWTFIYLFIYWNNPR